MAVKIMQAVLPIFVVFACSQALQDCSKSVTVKKSLDYDLPYKISGLARTSKGNLAMVEYLGQRGAAIFSTSGVLLRNLTVPGSSDVFEAEIDAKKLYIASNDTIYVFHENGTFIKSMLTNVTGIRRMVVKGDIIWLTGDRYSGLHKIVFDANYRVTKSALLVPADSQCYWPYGIFVSETQIILTCFYSHTIYFVDHAGSPFFPPLGGQGTGDGQFSYPIDVIEDECGRVYVVDADNSRVVLLSENVYFVKNLVTKQEGLLGKAYHFHLHNEYLYITYNDWSGNTHLLAVELS